jgi:hypothetical protein
MPEKSTPVATPQIDDRRDRGGYHQLSRIEQDLAELQIGAVVYEHLDQIEDGLAYFRSLAVNSPQLLAADQFEAQWRAANLQADRSVRELRELAAEASAKLLEVRS